MRVFLVVLLVAVAYPGFAALYSALHGAQSGGALAWSSRHFSLVWAGAAVVVIAALLVFEPPRSPSARSYLAQLRDRFRTVQDDFERAVAAALRDGNDSQPDAAGPEQPGPAPERLDGLGAADNTRR
ncbi:MULTISPECIES: hypothetical protein [Anaeromyxobacter]|uniref:hypothetical protein n=1 Tax=Anaeromyxobacter TaxID=161492 RepID=UPI001F5A8E56|nr:MULTISPECIES: hypothetical protein [unclassified Anaeromyxobacter]